MMNHEKLICHQASIEVAKKLPNLIRKCPYYLVDQASRAISSVVLNIAEGNSRIYPKERKRFFNTSLSSAKEVSAVLDIAFALKFINEADQIAFKDQLLQIVKMLWKLN